MTTSIHLSPLQSSERHKHGHKLARLANALAFHLSEYNAKHAELRPFASRVQHAMEQYNKAIADANQFLSSIGYSANIPEFHLAIPGAIEYNDAELDLACGTMSEIDEEG